jgi:hypothetical protein
MLACPNSGHHQHRDLRSNRTTNRLWVTTTPYCVIPGTLDALGVLEVCQNTARMAGIAGISKKVSRADVAMDPACEE